MVDAHLTWKKWSENLKFHHMLQVCTWNYSLYYFVKALLTSISLMFWYGGGGGGGFECLRMLVYLVIDLV